MFRIAICDDCSYQIKAALCLIDAYQENRLCIDIQTRGFDSGDKLISDLDEGNTYNLFLLDILMPGRNGIELAREIRARDADVPLVFLTASKDYALDAFGVSAVQYLVKPIKVGDLFPLLDKIAETFKLEDERCFMLSTSERIVRVPFSSIVCIELSGRALQVYQKNGKVLVSKTIRSRFEDIVAPLLVDSRFLCPHKSYVINMALVEGLTGTSFAMKCGTVVPIPRYRFAEVKAKYIAWLAEHGVEMMGGVCERH